MARKAKPRKSGEAREAPFFTPFAKLKAKKSAPKHEAPGKPASAVTAPRAPAPAPRPPAASAAADAETFAIYMAGVRALEDGATRIPRTASQVERAERGAVAPEDPDAAARASMRSLVSDGIRFEVSDDGELLDGRRLDVDPRELRRLRRGSYAVDGTLDLHGMTADAARDAVEAFVHKRRSEGDRVVVIIHGKGNHSPRGIGVLRGEIAAWLSQGKAARDVAAFASSSDGGGPARPGGPAGSVMVLLAR
jgi:DNA-nicking Smr family endonuclease